MQKGAGEAPFAIQHVTSAARARYHHVVGFVERKTSSGPAAAGLHFAAFVPASRLFHRARLAMDGLLPDGTNLRAQIADANNGINAIMAATHRQNFVIPPRSNRSFPLAELL